MDFITYFIEDMKENISLTKNLKVTRKQVLVAFIAEPVLSYAGFLEDCHVDHFMLETV